MYKISVVRQSSGSYQVNHYRKLPAIPQPDFNGVMTYLRKVARARPEIFKEEPALVGLPAEEAKTVRTLRAIVLKLTSDV